MKLELKRIAKRSTYTIGRLYIDGVYFCDTLEDTDRGLTSEMSEAEIKRIKVYGQTAIPTGTYNIEWHFWNKYKKHVPHICGVKGFTGILIHSGNDADDTSGCVLLGRNTQVGKVLRSRETCEKLFNIVKPVLLAGDEVTISIS